MRAHAPLPRAILLYPNDGCLTIARVLRTRGVAVHALTDERYRYVLASRKVQGRVMPHIRTHPQAWIDELHGLAEQGSGVIVSGSDEATAFLAHNRAAIPAGLSSFESHDGVHLALMDKFRLYGIAAEAGVRVPWMQLVSTSEELARARTELPYPCILKPTLGHLAKSALGFGTRRIETESELLEVAGLLLGRGIDFLLTEHVPGPESGLCGAVTIRESDGTYRLEYGRRKIRQWPLDYGAGSLLECADVPEMLKLNRQLLDHAGFRGLSSCEAKRHAETGELCLIEINVRIPANYGLSHACGVDGAWRVYATLAGLPLPAQKPPVPGRKVVMHPDLLAVRTHLRTRRSSVSEVLASWRGTRDFGVLSARDPGPVAVLAGQVIRSGAARLFARSR